MTPPDAIWPWLECGAWILEMWAAPLGLAYGVITWGANRHRRGHRTPFMPVNAGSRRPPPRKIWVLIAAHDEETVIDGTVRNIRALAPAACCVVVADRCQDATNIRARAAGGRVLERSGGTASGKGGALAWLCQELGSEMAGEDLVILLDADNRLLPGAMDAWCAAYRDGYEVIQGVRDAMNPDGMSGPDALAESIHHQVMAPGLVWWGLGPSLSGSGTAFTARRLENLLGRTRTLVEDFEWQLALARDGIPIAWAPGARILDAKTPTGPELVQQRMRWIRGKWCLSWHTILTIWRPGRGSISARLRQLGWIGLQIPRTWITLGLVGGSVHLLWTAWPQAMGTALVIRLMVQSVAIIGFAWHIRTGIVQTGRPLPRLRDLGRFAAGLIQASVTAIATPWNQTWSRTPRRPSSAKRTVTGPDGAGD